MRGPAVLSVVVSIITVSTGSLRAQVPPQLTLPIEHGSRNASASTGLLGGPSLPSRLLTAVGAAAIGAGAGYFASQIVRGDWDDGARSIDRPAWAAVGGSIGFAVGFSFPLTGRGRAADVAPGLERTRFSISGEELDEINVQTAYEAVRLLRPEWLNDRGPHIIGETGDETIRVYQDGVRLGGLSWLGMIQADHVRSMRFLDAAEATNRFGAGNSHGAILVVTGIRTGEGGGGAGGM